MNEHCVILTLSGEYDIAQRSALRAEFEAVRDSANLIVDLSGITFFDSASVGELLGLHAARVSAGYPPLTVVQNELVIKRLFELLGLDLVLRTAGSIDEVLAADHGAVVRQYATGGDLRSSMIR